MNTKITTVIFAASLGVLSVVNLLTPIRTFSENENRYLQGMPEFSLDALMSGKFTSEFDRFITDQFAFRDGWVGLKSLSELALQKRSSNGVYFARDGYLIEMFDIIDSDQYEKNLETVSDFTQRVQLSMETQVNTMLVPTASMLLADKLPRHAPEVDQRALLMQAQREIPSVVDVSVPLGSHAGEYIYYRTDHHWTSLGAYYAYEAYRRELGEEAPSLSRYQQEILSNTFYGTTYSKASLYTARPDIITAWCLEPPVTVLVDYNNGQTVTDSIYERSFLGMKDKYSVFLNANQPITRITTDNGNGRRLLLIKDSYANTFAQMALNDYETIDMIDLRYYKMPVYDYIEQNGITDVLILYSIKGFAADSNLFYLNT